jgi:hypothetical protein
MNRTRLAATALGAAPAAVLITPTLASAKTASNGELDACISAQHTITISANGKCKRGSTASALQTASSDPAETARALGSPTTF